MSAEPIAKRTDIIRTSIPAEHAPDWGPCNAELSVRCKGIIGRTRTDIQPFSHFRLSWGVGVHGDPSDGGMLPVPHFLTVRWP